MPENTVFQTPNLYGPAQSFGLTNRYDYKGLDPELALAERAADQRQLIANAILNQSGVPRRGKMVGRLYQKAHWAEGLGQLGEAAAGTWMSNDIQKARQQAEQDSTQRVTDAITKFNSATQDEPAGTVTHAAQPAVSGNFEQAMADPRVPYEMGRAAQPERTDVSPGLPVDATARQAAMAQLAMSPHPQVKEFYQNQLTLAKEAKTEQRADASAAESTRQFGVTSGIQQQIQDLAQRRETDEQTRYARELYEKGTQHDADLFEKKMEARQRAEDNEANRLMQLTIATGHDAASRANAQASRDALPRGMEMGPDGEPQSIKNSPAYMKEAKSAFEDRAKITAAQSQAFSLGGTIDRMLSAKNTKAFDANFGVFSGVTRPLASIGNEDVQNVARELKQVMSVASVMGLAGIRASAGSPGSITEKEWLLFQSLTTSLGEQNSPSEARRLLGEMKALIRDIAETQRNTYRDLHTDRRHDSAIPIPTLDEYIEKKNNAEKEARLALPPINEARLSITRGPDGKLVMP